MYEISLTEGFLYKVYDQCTCLIIESTKEIILQISSLKTTPFPKFVNDTCCFLIQMKIFSTNYKQPANVVPRFKLDT